MHLESSLSKREMADVLALIGEGDVSHEGIAIACKVAQVRSGSVILSNGL